MHYEQVQILGMSHAREYVHVNNHAPNIIKYHYMTQKNNTNKSSTKLKTYRSVAITTTTITTTMTTR